ncbi:septum site-determining protein MinC [Microcystis aeruginosa CS-338/01]|uniref:septum site-determining protein MinC n=1 Tax=Microcystis aeruginosa TaxID=1126 RepID=UPI00232B7A6C|nr:septum site-determining protein MinC [Microcystis aeruginosa]MDB9508839.1 septum site-determining protein MinC [Microcystis aeruginosa CS-338/01]
MDETEINQEIDLETEKIAPSASVRSRYAQIHLKSEGEKLVLILPETGAGETSQDWTDILTGLKYYLRNSGQNCPARTPVHLQASDRLMDTRQLQAIATILDSAELPLHTIQTQRRQTAVAAATMGYNVEQMQSNATVFGDEQPLPSLLAEPLYLKTTLRSGVEIRHPGTVIIMGDVNPGGSIVADGDILVWGSLRGVAHAGFRCDRAALIMALRIDLTQLRIAELVARAPALDSDRIEPEIACISEGGIRIIGAYNFSRTYTFKDKVGWVEKR